MDSNPASIEPIHSSEVGAEHSFTKYNENAHNWGFKVTGHDDLNIHVDSESVGGKQKYPKATFQHAVDDLHGLPPRSGKGATHPAIAALANGEGRHIGKGNESVAWSVGNHIVKRASPVAYHPIHHKVHDDIRVINKRAKDQADLSGHFRKAGINATPTEYHEHEGRGYTVQPKLDIDSTMNDAQLKELGESVKGMHAQDYEYRDQLQAGLDDQGKPSIFDLGTVRKGKTQHSEKDDAGSYRNFTREHGSNRRIHDTGFDALEDFGGETSKENLSDVHDMARDVYMRKRAVPSFKDAQHIAGHALATKGRFKGKRSNSRMEMTKKFRQYLDLEDSNGQQRMFSAAPSLIQRFAAAYNIQRYGQGSLWNEEGSSWNEDDHPREVEEHTDDHGLKEPGEFAPKEATVATRSDLAYIDDSDVENPVSGHDRRDHGPYFTGVDEVGHQDESAWLDYPSIDQVSKTSIAFAVNQARKIMSMPNHGGERPSPDEWKKWINSTAQLVDVYRIIKNSPYADLYKERSLKYSGGENDNVLSIEFEHQIVYTPLADAISWAKGKQSWGEILGVAPAPDTDKFADDLRTGRINKPTNEIYKMQLTRNELKLAFGNKLVKKALGSRWGRGRDFKKLVGIPEANMTRRQKDKFAKSKSSFQHELTKGDKAKLARRGVSPKEFYMAVKHGNMDLVKSIASQDKKRIQFRRAGRMVLPPDFEFDTDKHGNKFLFSAENAGQTLRYSIGVCVCKTTGKTHQFQYATQGAFEWVEEDHPREVEAHTDDHGLKEPGEFAPKQQAPAAARQRAPKAFAIWDTIPKKADKRKMLNAIHSDTHRGQFIADIDNISRSLAGRLMEDGIDPITEIEKPTTSSGQDLAIARNLIYNLIDIKDTEAAERGGIGEGGEREYENENMQEAFDWITWGPGEDIPQGDPMQDRSGWSGAFPGPDRTRNFKKELKQAPKISKEEGQARIDQWKQKAIEAGQNEDNSGKIVISLFDYTGAWSQPWRDAGYQVVQMDQKIGTDVFTSDYLPNLIEEMGGSVVGVMSACPCITYTRTGMQWWPTRHDMETPEMLTKVFGLAALNATNPKTGQHFKSALEYNTALYEYTKDIINKAQPKSWHALENPATGRFHKPYGKYPAATDVGSPSIVFDPSNFGDDYTKETGFWGDFNTNLPTANVKPTKGSKIQSSLSGSDPVDRVARSLTPDGVAYAFFMANHFGGDESQSDTQLFSTGQFEARFQAAIERYGQRNFEWVEEDHPREEKSHDTKRPGEFAPKEAEEAYYGPRRKETGFELERPIKGPSGASFLGYDWRHFLEESVDNRGELVTKRVSDWDEHELSHDTGRKIVHLFSIETPDGDAKTMSMESMLKAMGFINSNSATSVKSLANAMKNKAIAQFQFQQLPEEKKWERANLQNKINDYDEKIKQLAKLAERSDNTPQGRIDFLTDVISTLKMFHTTDRGTTTPHPEFLGEYFLGDRSKINAALDEIKRLQQNGYQYSQAMEDAKAEHKKAKQSQNYSNKQNKPEWDKGQLLFEQLRRAAGVVRHKSYSQVPDPETSSGRKIGNWYKKHAANVTDALADAKAWLEKNHPAANEKKQLFSNLDLMTMRFSKHWNRFSDVARYGQRHFEWVEEDHPREVDSHVDDHGQKKPGEFAPKDEGPKKPASQMLMYHPDYPDDPALAGQWELNSQGIIKPVWTEQDRSDAAEQSNKRREWHNQTPHQVVIVGCGEQKHEGTHAAKDLYRSSYFKLHRQYAETKGDNWFVVSGLHGLLDPDEQVESYEYKLRKYEQGDWARDVVESLAKQLGKIDKPINIEIAAGRNYADPIEDALKKSPQLMGKVTVSQPMTGMGIGQRQGWLKKNIDPQQQELTERVADGFKQMRQAQKNGEISEVDGKFYKAGRFMPVHGKFSGLEKPKNKRKSKASSGVGLPLVKEDSEFAARSESEKQAYRDEQAKKSQERLKNDIRWQTAKSGDISDLFWLGNKPGKTGFNVKKQMRHGLAKYDNEKLKQLADWGKEKYLHERTSGGRGVREYDFSRSVESIRKELGDEHFNWLTENEYPNEVEHWKDMLTKKFQKGKPDFAEAILALRTTHFICENLPMDESMKLLEELNELLQS